MKLIKRISDGVMFRASHPPDWNDEDAMRALTSEPMYYFRAVEQRRRFCRGSVCEDTGEIWETADVSEFELVDE